jgi:hypothetical protein
MILVLVCAATLGGWGARLMISSTTVYRLQHHVILAHTPNAHRRIIKRLALDNQRRDRSLGVHLEVFRVEVRTLANQHTPHSNLSVQTP